MTEISEEQQKKRYWSKRAVSAVSEIKQSKKTGLFPTREEYRAGNNPQAVKKDSFRNVVEHELVEAEAADVLAEKLGLPEAERKVLRTAALLHDVRKRRELEKAEKEGPSGFDESAKEQSDWIISQGYSDEVVKLTESTGHTSLEEFTRNFDSIPTVRKIMHYVDDITLNNDLVLLDDRMDYLEENQKYKELNEEGKKIFGRPYFEVQREVSKRIEEEFAPRLGISDPTQIPLFIKGVIQQRINSNE